jgi:hypothetical protein
VADELHIAENARALEALVFERWGWVEQGVEVGSDDCRAAWLPVIGPAAWLLWGSVTRELAKEPRVEWSVPEIARFHGISCNEVTAAIERLGSYGLAVRLAPARWRVRLRCPPALTRTVEVPRLAAPAGRRPQLWSSRNRPVASRGTR